LAADWDFFPEPGINPRKAAVAEASCGGAFSGDLLRPVFGDLLPVDFPLVFDVCDFDLELGFAEAALVFGLPVVCLVPSRRELRFPESVLEWDLEKAWVIDRRSVFHRFDIFMNQTMLLWIYHSTKAYYNKYA
jgi:hypothetical protein